MGRIDPPPRPNRVKTPVVQASQTNYKGTDLRNNSGGNPRPQLTKPPPLCFVYNVSVSRHFLEDCKMVKIFANKHKKRVVVGVGQCLNCFFWGHIVRMVPSRCRRCVPATSSKHASALHELYARFHVGGENGSSGPSNVLDTETREFSSEDKQPAVAD